MGASGEQPFRLITVHGDDGGDEDELVVHAGSGRPRPPASGEPPVPGEPAAGGPAPGSPEPGDAASSDEAPQDPRRERLRRRAEEIEQAEAGLQDSKAFSKMRIRVLVALALLMVAFIVYVALARG